MYLEKNSTVVFIGDSITDFDRERPYGEGNGIGRSYVGLVDGIIRANDPTMHLRVINTGISGDNSRGMKDRWQQDVMALKPDYVSVLIGTNDVWRQFDSPEKVETHISPEEYRSNLKEILDNYASEFKGMILMTPYVMEIWKEDPMRCRMAEYGAIVKELAAEYGAVAIDLQKAFDDYFEEYPTASVNWDQIHPNIVGHCIIARAFLNGIGFEWTK